MGWDGIYDKIWNDVALSAPHSRIFKINKNISVVSKQRMNH